MAREAGLTIDRDGFTAEMEKQRARARASWKGADKARINPVYQELPRANFSGRETLETPAEVVAVLDGEIALDRTPFYAEAGGQVGDTGVLLSKETGEPVAVVETTYAPRAGQECQQGEDGGPAEARRPGDRARGCFGPQIHHAQSYRHAPSPCRSAHRAGDAREAGGQRGRAVAPALRLHPLRGDGPGGDWPRSSG